MIESSLNIFDKGQAGLPISLAYAPSATQSLYLEMEVAEGTTLLQALQQSG